MDFTDENLERLLEESKKTINRLNARNYALERQKNRQMVKKLNGGQVFTINYKKGNS